MSDQEVTPAAAPHKRLGLIHDPLGDLSSKRAESLAAFLEAALAPLWVPWVQSYFYLADALPLVPIMAVLLSYSAALQGIAWGSESRLNIPVSDGSRDGASNP